jgi:aminoglycoside 6'-N-acetyltransferase I
VQIRRVQQRDAAEWERMRQKLWPSPPGEHALEIAASFGGELPGPANVLLALDEVGRAIGFAEISIRPFAEGSYEGPVAYLEGWFVEEAQRQQGVGTALVAAVEDWARAQGLSELCSDAEIDNAVSQASHRALGFIEVPRLVCFRKEL